MAVGDPARVLARTNSFLVVGPGRFWGGQQSSGRRVTVRGLDRVACVGV